jgi:excisionase family DNA binding protein
MKFLKVGEAAEVLQVSPSKIKQYIMSGRLKAINVGQYGKRPQWRIHPDDLRNIKPEEPPRRTRRLTSSIVDF